MKIHVAFRAVRLMFIVSLVFSLALAVACKKEEQKTQKAPASGQEFNPYANMSVFDEAKKKLEKNPNDVDELFHLADLYGRNEQYAEAIETYKKVVALKPDMGYAYLQMGTAYDRLNKPEEAVVQFRKAVQYIPKNPVLYNNMGIAYGKMGKYNDEIDSLQKAIKLRKNYTAARYNLGMTYLKVGNKKAALKEYESLKNYDEGAAKNLMQEINKKAS